MSKLILTSEVSGLGSAGDVVEVKNGYARNYLIPQGFAVTVEPRRREADRADQGGPRGARARDARRGSGPQGQARGVAGQADGQGRQRGPSVRFGEDRATSPTAVAAAGLGATSTSAPIELAAPIKATGRHEATVRLRDDVVAAITLEVVAAK